MILPEQTLESVQVFDGKLLQVYRDRILVAGTTESIREWIRHPGAAAVVPIFDDGTTLLVRQWRYAAGASFLEVPAGKLDVEGEPPERAARRELEEETGWKAGRLHYLTELYPAIGYANEIIHFYVAEKLVQGAVANHVDEPLEVVRLPLSEALLLAERGELKDMKSVLALRLAADYQSTKSGGDPN